MEMSRNDQSGMISRAAKKCAAIVLPLVFVLSLLLLFPQQAFASGGTGAKHKPLMTHHIASVAFVRCSGNGCNGDDPYATGCGSSFYVVAEVEVKNLGVELEYSPLCQTNWTQVID